MTKTWNSVLVHQHRSLFTSTVFKQTPEKQIIKTESPVLAGQREGTCHEEKETADIDLEFSSTFPLLFVTRASFRGLYSLQCIEAPTTFYIVAHWSSTFVFLWSRLLADKLSNPSRPLTSAKYRREDISISGCSTPAQNIWDFQFFLVIFNSRSHSFVIDWTSTNALAWLTLVSWLLRKLFLCFFFFFFSF